MPALPAITGLLKIALHYALEGAALAVSRHFLLGSSSTGTPNLNSMAQAIATSWGNRMAPVTMPNTTLYFVNVEDLSSPSAGTGNWAGSKPGTLSGGISLPAAAAMIITNLTNLRQRGGHSRVFLPGMDARIVSPSDNGEWTTGGSSNVLAAWGQYLSDVKAMNANAGYTSLSHTVPHYYKGNHAYIDQITGRAHNKPTLDPAGPQPIPIINNGVSLVIGTQSRRNQ